MRHISNRRAVALAAATPLVLLASACGSGASGDPEREAAAADAYTKYADMPAGEDRQTELVSEAEEEGSLVVAGSSSALPDLISAFEEQYDIDVELFDASSSEAMRNRILQQADAGQLEVDVIANYCSDVEFAYAPSGILAEYTSEVTEELPEDMRTQHCTAAFVYPWMVSYNTDLVSDPPTSYEDLADPKWEGELGMVPGNGAIYYALHEYYAEQGMSDDEFAEMWTGIAANSRSVPANSTLVELVGAGDLPVGVQSVQFAVMEQQEGGAPISVEPVVEPIVTTRIGLALAKEAPNPAAATLFLEWLVTEGQQNVVEGGYYPSNPEAVPGGVPFSLDEYERVVDPLDDLDADTYSQWLQAYERLLQGQTDGIIP